MQPADAITPEAPADAQLYCPECEYNLTGLAGGRCPECGWKISATALLEQTRARPGGRRAAAVFAGLFVAACCILALASMANWRVDVWNFPIVDRIAVIGVLLASGGHGVVALIAWKSRRRWPVRAAGAWRWLGWVAWASVVAGVVGATRMLAVAPSPLFVRGVRVNGAFEFVLAAALLTLPGWMLLLMRSLTMQPVRRTTGGMDGAGRGSVLPERATFRVEFFGPIEPARISTTFHDKPVRLSPAADMAVAQTWEVEAALAEQEGRRLYNGSLARLGSWQADGLGLQLTLGPTCYRDFLGTNLRRAAVASGIPEGERSDALGVSALIVTADGMLVLGRRSERVAYHAGHLHTFGGMVESVDRLADGTYDVVGCVLREVCEELPLRHGQVAQVSLLGLARDRAILQPELLFEAQVTASLAVLRQRFEAGAPDEEHVAIESVPARGEAVIPFLMKSAPVAPVAEASLLLYGRVHWGTSWYERTCVEYFGEVPRV